MSRKAWVEPKHPLHGTVCLADLRCQFCGSANVKINSAHTLFCMDCHYCISRNGNVSRTGDNPYADLGWEIRPHHPDADKFYTEVEHAS